MAAPFWIKLAASELVRHKVVASAKISNTCLTVRYMSGVEEKYYYSGYAPNRYYSFRITEKSAKITDPIPIHRNFETNPLDDEEKQATAHHLFIDKKKFRAGTLLDQRMVINRFIAYLVRNKPDHDAYPKAELKQYLDELRGYNFNTFVHRGAFNFYRQIPMRVPWRQVMWHFFPIVLDYSPMRLASVLRIIGDRKRCDISTTTVHRLLLYARSKPLLNPMAYCAIFQKLGATSVIDLHPSGHKTIAAALLDMEYITPSSDLVQFALDCGLSTMTGLSHQVLADQKADLLICDDNFRSFTMAPARKYLTRVNRMIAYAPRAKRLRLVEKYNPASTIQILRRYCQGRNFKATKEEPDFLLLW